MKKRILSLMLALLMMSFMASCGKDENSSEAGTKSASEEISSVNSAEASEDKSEAASEEKSEEVSEEEEFMAYKEDKSGYLKGEQTENLNFNSKTIKALDFKGTFKDAHIDENGRLVMDDGDDLYFALFESDVMNVGEFSSMLISWNANAGDGKVQVYVSYEAEDGTWSDYFTFGVWSDKKNVSTSKSKSDDYAKMNVDTFSPKKQTTGNIKFKINLLRNGKYRPVLENITIATPEMKSATPGKYPEEAIIDVPMRSQHAPENGSRGNVMCSATTVAMALEHLGFKQSTYDTAMGTYDVEYDGYGNWLFSVAEAGSKGYYTFCDFYNEDMMKYALSKGYTIGCSTMLTQAGHVVLVTGYTVIDGVEYYVVNDPNVNSSKVEVTNYTCEYFNSVWLKSNFNNLGVVYVFQGQY
ncbi:MAG: hypothetical protein E7614_02315 [Ruminococcaceae bacterium]|nr:hypothetical protein [Oscillospiraceae bacterium]